VKKTSKYEEACPGTAIKSLHKQLEIYAPNPAFTDVWTVERVSKFL